MNNFITPIQPVTSTRYTQPISRAVEVPFGLGTMSEPYPPQAKPFTPRVDAPQSVGSRIDYFA